jgi:uncharacterized protein involved in exopolysaccharide biosynthesis
MVGNQLEEKNTQDALILVGGNRPFSPWNTRDLLSTAFRHSNLLIGCFSAICVLAVLAAITRPPEYASEAKVLVKHERSDPLVTPGTEQIQSPDRSISAEELNSELELIQNDDLLRGVVLACGLEKRPRNGASADRNVALAVLRLRSRLRAAVVRKTNVLSLRYTSPSPETSAKVLSTVLAYYLDKHVTAHSLSNQLEFFDQQVERYQQDLAKANEELERFTQVDGSVAPGTQRDAILQRENEFSASLQQTNSAIAETQERIRTLKKQAANTPLRVTTQLRDSDNPQLLQDLKATLLKLELRRTDLLSKFRPSYPPVQELDQEIANTKATLSSAESSPLRDKTTDVNPIRQWVDSELKKAETELAALHSRAEKTEGIVHSYDRLARNLDSQQLRYEALQRSAKSAEGSYLLYVRKREDARIASALDKKRILNVTVIEPATRSVLPTTSRSFYLLVGAMLAFVLAAGMIVILQHIDNTFRTPRQLEESLQVPVLATVPLDHLLSSNAISTRNRST